MKTPSYWLLVAALALHNIITGGFTIHIIPFLTDAGIDATIASAMMGMMIFFTIPARFFGGIIADRLKKEKLKLPLAFAMFLHVIGIGSFIMFQNTAAMYFLLVCYGLSLGAGTPLFILILGRYFGRKAFGAILGTSLSIFAPLALIAPVYAGWIYDSTGNYTAAFISFLVSGALALIIVLFTRPPRKPYPGGA